MVVLFVITAVGTPTPFPPHRHRWDISLRYTSPCRSFALVLRPRPQLILKDILAIRVIPLHDEELAVVDVAEVFEIFDTPVVPFHQEDAGHEAVRD